MYDFFRKTRGAVSIFLIIILLPTMTCAGVFIDISRAKMAEEVVYSSADLALNTTLTDYDKDLKDYFGLLASCQDTKEVIEVSKQYFVDSMVSAGVTTSEAGAYANNIMSAFFGDDDIQDMLQISVEGDVTISRTTNGAMDNPALIKEGVSEFMKYRAPINGVADLFSKITESDVTEKIENASKETKMIEARDAFYTAEKDLIKQGEKTYKAIEKYEKFKTHTGASITSEDYLHDLANFLAAPHDNKDFKTLYKDAHILMTMNLFNTHNSSGTNQVSLIGDRYIWYHEPKTTFSEEISASTAQIESRLINFNNAINTYCNARSNLESAWNNIGSMRSGDWPIQYWVQLTNKCSSAYYSYVNAANDLWEKANIVENAVAYAAEDAMQGKMGKPSSSYVSFDTPGEDGLLTLSSVESSLWWYYAANLQYEVTSCSGSSAYRNVNSQINQVKQHKSLLNLETVTYIYNIRNTAVKYVNDFNDAAKLAKTAANETKKLKDEIEKYEKAFQKWKEIAFDSDLDDSDLAVGDPSDGKLTGDRELIKDLEENGGLYDLKKESATDLYNRIKNIQTLFETFAKDIEDIKYNGTSILNVSDYKSFRSKSKLNANSIPVNENSLRKYADDTFSFSIGVQIQRVEIYENRTSKNLDDGDAYVITSSFHPNIEKTSAFLKLTLYDWLVKMFKNGPSGGKTIDKDTHGFDASDEKSAEDASADMETQSEDVSDVSTKESTSGKNFSDWKGATLPSNGNNKAEEKSLSAKIGDASSYVTSLFSNFSGTFKDSLVSMRDDLLVEDYIFSMFTYDTFDYEGCYSLLSEDQQKGLKPSTKDQVYDLEKWRQDKENLTLTLNPRTAQYNWCYGGEVEYLLYGNTNNQKNKTTAYANIYLIRYALDLAPIFQLYWDDPILNAVATALQALAYIPVSFTKTVACLAITAAEAGVDISYLKAGIPVLIYKSDKGDLFCNYRTVFLQEEKTVGSSDGIKLQYSDYLKMFMFVKLTSDENQIYLRLGDVIQANMTLASKKSDYALSKAQVFYTLHAVAKIEPTWSRMLEIDDLGDLSQANGWRTIDITMTRGY